MLKNFITLTFRNLWKTKGYSFLNIFGLAVGIAAASLIFLWVEDEVNYNDFPNKDALYIVNSKQFFDGNVAVFSATQGPLAPAIESEIPGIQSAVRLDWGTKALFSVDEKRLYQQGRYVDPGFLNMFSVQFLSGDSNSALNDLNNIVLSETAAQKLFGSVDVIGKIILLDNDQSYKVSGVVKGFPKNSSFAFDWLVPFENFEKKNEWLKTWNNNGIITLVQTEPHADIATINSQIKDFVQKKVNSDFYTSENFIYPMTRLKMYNNFDKSGNEQEGRIKYVRLFSFIAWVVLLIACINFMNLSTARSEKRAKEVSMRKVMGAGRGSLIRSFLGESFVYAILATLVAVVLVWIFLKPFNTMVDKDLMMQLFSPLHLGFLLGIIFICGLVSGSYPAFYLSSFNPLSALKGVKRKGGSAGMIRRGLVILQFTAAIVLMISTVLIYQQIQHAKNRDIGFEKSQVITTSLKGDMYKHLEVIKSQLLATGVVDKVGLANSNVLNIGSNASGFDWEGKDPNASVLISMLTADADFIPSLGMELVDGRNFYTDLTKEQLSLIINETLAKLIQEDGLVAGKTIERNGQQYTITGVVKDFIFNDVYTAVEPLVIFPFEQNFGVLYLKTKASADLPQTLAKIEQVIKSQNPEYPFEYKFLDETFNDLFYSELLIQRLSQVFAILCIIISCLGLFGLAAYSAEIRAKEISIRKVLGASVKELVMMLNKEFLALVALSALIAFPISWWIMNSWIENFEYHIKIPWTLFVAIGLLAMFIALLTISSQALKAALTDPAKMLRDE
ncbi:MAG TPA: ABC transporter permease [Gelidibacter sp.]|uniref:ABC transporter permease n=1 Tax=Gelidibacter sp. TaxID=2018083 RepID=UPI002BD732EB|nr:ABC transporter permease [Gelidibacter sp.]HXJ99158.1 ABC transporter permease [Gelidibacter sp.]